jgi:hypothetical protein
MPNPLPNQGRQFQPSSGIELLPFLAYWDSSPKLLPVWPKSQKMGLVVVFEESAEMYTAWVLFTDTAMEAVADADSSDMRRRMFFTVPAEELEAEQPGSTGKS